MSMETLKIINYIILWFAGWILLGAIFIYQIQKQFDKMTAIVREADKQLGFCIKERKICLDDLERAYTKIEKYEHINEKI